MMRYKGYTATVEYDPSVNMLHGRVDNIQGVISFAAKSTEDLQSEFEASVDDYLTFCAEHGIEPEKPYSGRLVLRLDPGVHRAVALSAKKENESINGWITRAVLCELDWANNHASSSRRRAEIDADVLSKMLTDFVEHFGNRQIQSAMPGPDIGLGSWHPNAAWDANPSRGGRA